MSRRLDATKRHAARMGQQELAAFAKHAERMLAASVAGPSRDRWQALVNVYQGEITSRNMECLNNETA